jgi:hypothetical protein
MKWEQLASDLKVNYAIVSRLFNDSVLIKRLP